LGAKRRTTENVHGEERRMKFNKRKLFRILRSWRVILLAIVILFSLVAIKPNPLAKGVLISSVDINSSAYVNGVEPGVLLSINGETIETAADLSNILAGTEIGNIISLETKEGSYSVVVEELDGSKYLGINLIDPPTSNIKKGLDLVGGTRVILRPAEEVTEQEISDIVDIIKERLNVYGVSDIVARPTRDLQGNDYIIVELAGTSQETASDLLSQQGKFEAKIGNETVFAGGEDITYVCRSADCSGIDITRGCGQSENGWACSFQFLINLKPEAAKKHADVTRNIPVIIVGSQRYLEDKLDLYLDDVLVDSLFISENLKGSETTSITIQGPGSGTSRDAAVQDALANMKQFQTVLISGSLPIKLEVVKMDIVSPTLGEKFLESSLLALFAALVAVGVVVFIRYRKLSLAIPILITGLSEVLIILGFASLINWNLDLAAIAGILAAVGTGVDDQIVITDEALRGAKADKAWKDRMKHAFFIIFAAYFTTLVAMLPLWWMGAGLIRGFALTTIAGVTIGVLVTRPAYAAIIEILLKSEDEE